MTDHHERRASRLSRLTHTHPDTTMGKLLRRFWHPVAVSRTLAPGTAQALRILCEDLTLYRGESGEPHLVSSRCPHRGTLLSTGWVEGDAIRCMYHGWAFDAMGACIDRPAERDEQPCRVRIAGYPVREYGGLIFAYMGAGEPPEFDLPRKDVFEEPGRILYARSEIWNVNWLQMNENSLDAVHVSFVHQKGASGRFIHVVSTAIPTLDYVETDAGIRQIATRGEGNVRISDWTFPNNNHISVPGLEPGDNWIDVGHWNTPIDDEHTFRLKIWSTPAKSEEADARITAYFHRAAEYDPANHHDELFAENKFPDDPLFGLTAAQDYLAQRGQGVIADRENEVLGRSDAGLAFLRRLYFRELDALDEGRESKRWSRLKQAAVLTKPVAAH